MIAYYGEVIFGMGKMMKPEELKAHCDEAIVQIQKLLDELSSSERGKTVKRAMLLAYWLKTYVQYILKEDSFSPQSVFKLKRGSVVRVEFGYRVGRELGGRHYAVVLDAENSIYRNTVTVVPLGSLKEGYQEDQFSVLLEDGIYEPVYQKIIALIDDSNRILSEVNAMREEIMASPPETVPARMMLLRQKLSAAEAQNKTAEVWIKEFFQMKPGSVAKVDQITTVSKMRISAPLKKTHPLYGVRLSGNDLDRIDQRLQALYFPRANEHK